MFKTITPAVLLVLSSTLAGCQRPAGDLPIESMTLYSLDGTYAPEVSKPFKGETFHTYPVLGKTEIASPVDRREILAAVQKGIEEGKAITTTCFWPRHGISLLQSGRRVEYLICYQCSQLSKFTDGELLRQSTNALPAKMLNAYFEKAGVPRQKYEE
jgi:hypothetical protein